MRIEGVKITKRYQYRAIFSDLNFVIEPGQHIAVTGPNGAGKSTLLKIISGFLTASSGEMLYSLNGQNIDRDKVWKHVAYTGPYIDLIPTFSVDGFIDFYTRMRPLNEHFSVDIFLEQVNLVQHRNKEIDKLSSGMLQRLKLGLSLFTESDLVILDEPGTNLDAGNHAWYLDCMRNQSIKNKTCIVASNEPKDLETCQSEIQIKKR